MTQTPVDPTITAWLDEIENFGLRQERLVTETGANFQALLPWLQAAFTLGRTTAPAAQIVRETYQDLSDLHIFLQGFDAAETGALEGAFDALVQRVRDNALALEPLQAGAPAASEAALALQGVLPMAQWAMEMARAAGEGDDWGAAWESIYPVLNWSPGEGSLDEGAADAPEIERAKTALLNAGLEL